MLRIILPFCGFLFFGSAALAQNADCLDQLLTSEQTKIPHDRFFSALAEMTKSPEICAQILERALDRSSGKTEQPETLSGANFCRTARETWGDIKSTQSAKVLEAFVGYYAECPIYLALAQAKMEKFPTDGFPQKLGLFRIGDILTNGETYSETNVAGLSGYIEAITSVEGEVTHIVFYHDDASSLAPLLETFTKRLGTPTEGTTLEWQPLYSWMSSDGKRSFTLSLTEPCCGSDLQMVAVLETTDLKRLCGPEDGFGEWASDLQIAIEQNDLAAVANAFSYPFVRYEQVDNPDADFADSERVSFENAEELLAALPTNSALESILDAFEETDPNDMQCSVVAPDGQQVGYSIYVDYIGGVQFAAQQSGWKISNTFYVP